MRQIIATSIAAVLAVTMDTAYAGFSFAQVTDLHVGEGCGPGWYNGTDNCYSVHGLNGAIDKINGELIKLHNISFVVATGDVSSSAQPSQFTKARSILDRLQVQYFPMMGNHDIWTYTSDYNAPSPKGDAVFAKTFSTILQRPELLYNNVSTYNPVHNITSWFQNFEFVVDLDGKVIPQDQRPSEAAPTSPERKLVFLALDFNTRDAALPGYKGALPQADLQNFTGGSFEWLAERLRAPRSYTPYFYFLIHQPFRCPWYLPTWSFCWTTPNKDAFRTLLEQAYSPVDQYYWGQLAGHVHIWYNSTSFDEWPKFRLWESSATKGGEFDENMKSAIAVFHVNDIGTVDQITKYWTENGTWHSQTGQ